MQNKEVGLMIGEIYDEILEYVNPYENEVMAVLVSKCLEYGVNEKDLPVEFIDSATHDMSEFLCDEVEE